MESIEQIILKFKKGSLLLWQKMLDNKWLYFSFNV